MVDDEGDDFQASFPDIFADHQNPPLTGDTNMGNKAWDNWQHAPMTWWQFQLNFADWCATAGSGVSADDHLQAKDPLLASLYRLHVYYATRRLLVELKVALPGDNLILGIRTPTTPGPTSGSAPTSEFRLTQIGDKS